MELALPYASIALVTDYDCWREDDELQVWMACDSFLMLFCNIILCLNHFWLGARVEPEGEGDGAIFFHLYSNRCKFHPDLRLSGPENFLTKGRMSMTKSGLACVYCV